MSEPTKKRLFRPCKSCCKPRVYSEDPHKECLYCLYPNHTAKECKHCSTFSVKTLKDREARLLLWLQQNKSSETPKSGEEGEGISVVKYKRYRKKKDSADEPPRKKHHEKISEINPDSPGSSQTKDATSEPFTPAKKSDPNPKKVPSTDPVTKPQMIPSTTSTAATTTMTISSATSSSITATAISKSFSSTDTFHLPSMRPLTRAKGKKLRQEHTSPSKVSPLPHVHVLGMSSMNEDVENDKDRTFGTASSPSQMHENCQESDEEESDSPEASFAQQNFLFRERHHYYDRPYERFQDHYSYEDSYGEQCAEPSIIVPVSLIHDLKCMVQDYFKRFPKSDDSMHHPDDTIPQGTSPHTPLIDPDRKKTLSQTNTELIKISDDYVNTGEDDNDDGDNGPEEGKIPQDQDTTRGDEWNDYIVSTPSSPSPPPGSPPEDIGGFHDVIERAATRFELPIQVQQKDCFLYDFKEEARRSIRSIPIVDHIWDEGLKLMKNPATVAAVIPRLDKKYKATDNAPVCLRGHPKPDSLVMLAAQRRAKNPLMPCTAPPDKEGRRLDHIGKRFSAMASITIRAANTLAILGRYDRQMWSDLETIIDAFPDEKKKEAKSILLEGKRTSSEIIDTALDVALTGFRQMAGSAVLRRQGWLKATSFRPEVQSKILDLPYDGETLFGKHVDDALKAIKTDTDTAKALGTLLQRRFQPFRDSRGRGLFSYKGGYQSGRYQPHNLSQQPFRQQSSQQYRAPPSQAYATQPARRKRAGTNGCQEKRQ